MDTEREIREIDGGGGKKDMDGGENGDMGDVYKAGNRIDTERDGGD